MVATHGIQKGNWRCKTREKVGVNVEHSMTNGDYSELVDGLPSPSDLVFYPAPGWRWWLVRSLEVTGLSQLERSINLTEERR